MGKSFSVKPGHSVQCIVVNGPSCETNVRRTANYQASIWDYDYVQSLRSDYMVASTNYSYQCL